MNDKIRKKMFIKAIEVSFKIWLVDKVNKSDLDALQRFKEFLDKEKIIERGSD